MLKTPRFIVDNQYRSVSDFYLSKALFLLKNSKSIKIDDEKCEADSVFGGAVVMIHQIWKRSYSFSTLGLNDHLVNAVKTMSIDQPTWIQSTAIPHILRGSSTVIADQTGTGMFIKFIHNYNQFNLL